jgi:RNA polymerase sigma factor (sigma-70 family)
MVSTPKWSRGRASGRVDEENRVEDLLLDVAPDDTATLLAGAAAGDQAAWEKLVDRYANLVWSVARSFRLSDADAADVSQATWLRLVQHLGEIRQPQRLGAWLATTTRREALAVLRRASRDRPVGDLEVLVALAEKDPLPEAGLLLRERDDELRAAVAALPDRCRRLLRIMLTEPSPSYDEVAAAMGMPVGSIGPTRSRCLEHLRNLLRERVPG